jgi:hypothetical protein
VNEVNVRLAVSNALVDHWRVQFGYQQTDHVIIPCTIRADLSGADSSDTSSNSTKLVYAGSTAGWQSFGLLEQLLRPVLDAQTNIEVLFLSKPDENTTRLEQDYPGRVSIKWLHPGDVHDALSGCDYGLLLRDNTVTNQVASPTKFAEYLAAGLQVIISPNLGDMSKETADHELGIVWSRSQEIGILQKPGSADRKRAMSHAATAYTKEAYDTQYKALLKSLAS